MFNAIQENVIYGSLKLVHLVLAALRQHICDYLQYRNTNYSE